MRIDVEFRAVRPSTVSRARVALLARAQLWLLALPLLCSVAHAQPVNPDFQRGMDALQAGDNQHAAEALDAAYRADHSSLALLNLGIAYTNLGLLNHALDALEGYVRQADPTVDAQNIAAVRAEIDRLRNSNAVIELHATPAEVQVELDGQPVIPRAQELVVAPGNRRFVVSAPGYQPYDQTMAVPVGRFALDVVLQPVPAIAPMVAPVPVAAAAPSAAAPPPSAAAAQTASPPPPPPKDEDKAPCLLGETCLGPLLELGIPNVLGGGAHLRIGRYLGAGIDYQVIPMLHLGSVSAGTSLLTVEGRIYPFGGAFFLAGGFGYQHVLARASKEGATIEASVGIPTFKAGLGFMGHDGFVAGIDLGLMFPLAGTDVSLRMTAMPASTTGTAQAQIDNTVSQLQSDARKGVHNVVRALPFLFQVNLLRIGYLF